MLKSAILALIRQILTIAGTALVAKGLVHASDVEPVTRRCDAGLGLGTSLGAATFGGNLTETVIISTEELV